LVGFGAAGGADCGAAGCAFCCACAQTGSAAIAKTAAKYFKDMTDPFQCRTQIERPALIANLMLRHSNAGVIIAR
jgi:hypothetical protein